MFEERAHFTIGEEATFTKIISDEDITTFAPGGAVQCRQVIPNIF